MGAHADPEAWSFLERARVAAGLTQEALAERAGISVRGLRNLERGLIRRPRNSSLVAIADALSLTDAERHAFLDQYRSPGQSMRMREMLDGPEQLPRVPAKFFGRDDLLAAIDEALAGGSAGQVIAIHGPAGVGKSAVSVFWADLARDRFPDGRLFADLYGFGPIQPLDPSLVLARFLRALDVPPADIPDDLDARSALFRSRTAGLRLLVLLDNAHSAAQVRPMLSGAASVVTVVTSRMRLSGLSVRDGARSILVAPLPRVDATGLMTSLLGSARAATELAALDRIVELCAGLPLALNVVGERIAAHPERALGAVVDELSDDGTRLVALEVSDDELSDVRTLLSWSVELLAPIAQRVFRLLAVHPGPHFDAGVAAALVDIDQATAANVLETLADLHLVEVDIEDQFRFHDLVRVYAGELVRRRETPADQRSARTRLYDYLMWSVCRAADLADPPERAYLPDRSAVTTPLTIIDKVSADGWLDLQRANLLAVLATMDESDAAVASVYSDALWRHLHYRGLHTEALTLHETVARLAGAAGNDVARGRALRHLGATNFALGRLEIARSQLVESADIARRRDEPLREARALSFLGLVHKALANYDEALQCHTRVAELSRSVGNLAGEGTALGNAGIVLLRLGRYDEALSQFSDLDAVAEQTGDLIMRAATHDNIGLCCLSLGRVDDAAGRFEQAVRLASESGYTHGEGVARVNLARAYLARGQTAQAVRQVNRAHEIAVATVDAPLEVDVANAYGRMARAAARYEDALEHYLVALAKAHAVLDPYEQARAHEGIAAAYGALGRHGEAQTHLAHASAIYRELRLPHHVNQDDVEAVAAR